MTRSVVSPGPAYLNVAPPWMPVLPKSIVPLATVVGAPSELEAVPPTTLLKEETLSVPAPAVVWGVIDVLPV